MKRDDLNTIMIISIQEVKYENLKAREYERERKRVKDNEEERERERLRYGMGEGGGGERYTEIIRREVCK